MKTNALNLLSKIFKYALLSSASIYIIAYVGMAYFRIQYPFELEWIEGGMVDHVMRILSGRGIYVAPSLEFTPFIYNFLYFYLSAGLAYIIGAGFIPLRLVSFFSSLGCFYVIYLFVSRETGNKYSAVIASCLFAATFRISGAWFDIGRVDSLFLFFLLTALYFVRFGSSAKEHIWAGIFISLSFMTKQTALAISFPIMLYYVLFNRRYAIFFIGTTVAVIGLSVLIINYVSGGWYFYYAFKISRGIFQVAMFKFMGIWSDDIMSPLAIAFALSSCYLVSSLFLASSPKDCFYYLFVTFAVVGASWMSRSHGGGYNNTLIPAYAVISILFGLGLHMILQFAQTVSIDKRRLIEINIYLVCMLQFFYLHYNPFRQIPPPRDLQAGRKLIQTMARIDGEVYLPSHGYLPVLAGKNSYAHTMAVGDVLAGGDKQDRDRLINEISKAIREKKFAALLLDPFWSYLKIIDYKLYYEKLGPVFDSEKAFWPLAGMGTRPKDIYVPRK